MAMGLRQDHSNYEQAKGLPFASEDVQSRDDHMLGMALQFFASFVGVMAALSTYLILEGSDRRLVRPFCTLFVLLIAGAAGILLGRASFNDVSGAPSGMFAAWAVAWFAFSLGVPFLLGRSIMNRMRICGMAPLWGLATGFSIGIATGWFVLPFSVGMLLALLFAG
jgi:hypothetical protein